GSQGEIWGSTGPTATIVRVTEATSTTTRAKFAIRSPPSLEPLAQRALTEPCPRESFGSLWRKMSAKRDSIVTATRYRRDRSETSRICKYFRHPTKGLALMGAAKRPIFGQLMGSASV